MDLNAQLLREISLIISDKELTEKTLEFVRSLRQKYVYTSLKSKEETIGKEEMAELLKKKNIKRLAKRYLSLRKD